MGSCIVCSVLSIQEDLLSEVVFHSKTFLALKYLGQIRQGRSQPTRLAKFYNLSRASQLYTPKNHQK